jgi:hypothetical protein
MLHNYVRRIATAMGITITLLAALLVYARV